MEDDENPIPIQQRCFCFMRLPDGMDIPREFAYRLRDLELKQPVHISTQMKIEPKLKQLVQQCDKVKLTGDKHHAYYGEMKVIFNTFVRFWEIIIDNTIKEADRLKNTVLRDELMTLLDQTIEIQQRKQYDFAEGFLPAKTDGEMRLFQDLEEKFKIYMEGLDDLGDRIQSLDKIEKVKEFRSNHFQIRVESEAEIFEFAQLFVCKKLSAHFYEIRVSLEQILHRITNERNKLHRRKDENLMKMLDELYEKEKIQRNIHRMEHRLSTELAETQKAIDVVRAKILANKHTVSMTRMDDEILYWKTRISEFTELETDLKELKLHLHKVTEQENIFRTKISLKQPNECWEMIGENYRRRKEKLKAKVDEAAVAIMTFFTAKGDDSVQYEDDIGPYTICNYGHQVYHFDYGLIDYHFTCDGNKQWESNYITPYYFDENGRYILGPNKEKVYQYAPCGSTYKLDEDCIFEKTSADCGHSEQVNKKCKTRIRNFDPPTMLPFCEPVNIKGKLDSETVKYLWDTFGSILPYALHDVESARPKNPIHLLAHKILYYKYHRSHDELKKKQDEAQKYRADLEIKKNELASSNALLWKSKQVKRQEMDNAEDTKWPATNYYAAYYAFLSWSITTTSST